MPEKAKKSQENSQENIEPVENSPQEPEAVESGSQAAKTSDADYKAVIEDLNDKLLRAMAEAQNTRRRADLDIQNAKNFGIQSFAKDMIGVLDNLFRAAETITQEDVASDPKLKSILEGVEITKREMQNALERNGIKRIEPVGEAFDPNLHQAISQIPDANSAPGTVLQVLQAGYTLKDRLLRPALVVVSQG